VTQHAALATIKQVTARLRRLETDRATAVAAAVAQGCSWAEIGAALGVSAQAAHRRFRWLRADPQTGELWREPPLPL
jgi:DNA-directed RNA polymerase specialized sigma24 family protein